MQKTEILKGALVAFYRRVTNNGELGQEANASCGDGDLLVGRLEDAEEMVGAYEARLAVSAENSSRLGGLGWTK